MGEPEREHGQGSVRLVGSPEMKMVMMVMVKMVMVVMAVVIVVVMMGVMVMVNRRMESGGWGA